MKLCDTCIYRNNVEQLKPCIIYRDDCEYYEKERDDMKAIIQIDVPNYQIGQEVSIYFKDTMMIKGIVQEPKTGHWIETDSDDAYWYMCSECHRRTDEKSDYCPNCGAKMFEPHESDNCRDCKKWEDCPCGKDGHESGTSQGYSIGECKVFEPQESEDKE